MMFRRITRKATFFIQIHTKSLVFLLLLIILLFGANSLGFFKIKHIELANTVQYVDQSVVEDILQQQLGKNFFIIQQEPFVKQLKSMDFVKDVFVIKNFPNKVFIKIVEYTPQYIVFKEDKCSFWSSNLDNFLITDNSEVCEYWQVTGSYPVFVQDDLELGDISKFLVSQIDKIAKVLRFLGYDQAQLDVSKNYIVIHVRGLTIYINRFIDTDLQLKRLILIMKKVTKDNIKLNVLKLEYKRPVGRLEQ